MANLKPLDPPRYVEIPYRCRNPLCPSIPGKVQVRERGEAEGLGSFIDRVHQAVYIDHLNNAPQCRQASAEVRYPVTSRGVNGRPTLL
jgi:hypothetical protein